MFKLIIPSFSIVILLFLSYFCLKNRLLFYLITILSFLYILLRIIIIPYSYYSVWINVAKEKIIFGPVTDSIILLLLFITSIYLITLTNRITIIFFNYLLIIFLIILSIFYNQHISLLISITLFILNPVISILKNKSYKKLLTILYCILISTFLSFISVKETDPKGSALIDNISYFIRQKLTQIYPNSNILSNIPGIYKPFVSSTGKAPILTNDKIFRIIGKPGYEYYIRMDIEEISLPEENKDILLASNKTKNDSVDLIVLSDFITILPNILYTTKINDINISDRNFSTIKLDKPLIKNKNIRIIYHSYSLNKYNRYIPVDKNINNIKNLASKLKGDNDYETINNIKAFLLNNYKYSMSTEESNEYILDFLFSSKQGYCVHFTRAFIALARLNGIISREVSGYYIKLPENIDFLNNITTSDSYITGKNAHLWPEVYIENNWITFEVTPSINNIINNKSNSNLAKNRETKVEIIKKKNSIIFFLILFLLLFVLLTIIYKKYYLYLIILRYGYFKKIPHPNKIGWVKWINIAFNNKEIESLFLETIYNKNKKTIKQINKIRKLLKSIR